MTSRPTSPSEIVLRSVTSIYPQESYLTPSNGYIGFPYHPQVRPKRHGTVCAISPKGEGRTHRPRVSSVPKAKLGHSNRVRHQFLKYLGMYPYGLGSTILHG